MRVCIYTHTYFHMREREAGMDGWREGERLAKDKSDGGPKSRETTRLLGGGRERAMKS
jgi:hypothetical protein